MRCWSSKPANPINAVVSIDTDTKALQSIPERLQQSRRCIIYRPAKSAMQSGTHQTHHIRLEFDKTTTKWESRVLGWTSSADSVQGLVMQFGSVEEAELFCQKQGLLYDVKEHSDTAYQIKPKLYADNFRYSADKLKLIRTK
jgi:NADH dehydrogenase (ubiquinone) Fe-S protein 4